MDNLLHFDIQEVISAFVVLFAVIDITGLVPIIIDLKEKGNEINAGKAAFYSLFSFIVFLFMGNMMLQLFHVDISSFSFFFPQPEKEATASATIKRTASILLFFT